MKHFAEVDDFFKQRQEVGYSFLCSEELTVLTDTRAYVNNSIATPRTAADCSSRPSPTGRTLQDWGLYCRKLLKPAS